MAAKQDLSVSLPAELADMVRAKVESGEYASESDMVGEGLLALKDRDEAMNDWLHYRVGPAYDRLQAEPDAALSIADVRRVLSGDAGRNS